ncbi:MAG: hypothetical protein LJE69_10880 [Thiohalocapsa sp.]|jgi:hypothetical protein|uniref:hypothetical protein n=1 Tax=Thiohalocapsa sp. TaxID=2497641 RepID=UPI0025E8F8CB|nr:hypothetical protein [Thiohalocapsa sp.]MCG6941737.1 hypothetical protein [Thiohalocapsa sp.]
MPDSERQPKPAPARDTTGFRYQPFYCEENAWWLCAEPALGDGPRHVVFLMNRQGACPLAAQKAAPPGGLCWWDYHVVLLDGSARIWDLDSRLGCPVPAGRWLTGSFPSIEQLPSALQPLFRLVPAADYRADFASDRSHMRSADGGWLHPPPSWPPIGTGMNLPSYRSTVAGGPGELLDWQQMLGRVGG